MPNEGALRFSFPPVPCQHFGSQVDVTRSNILQCKSAMNFCVELRRPLYVFILSTVVFRHATVEPAECFYSVIAFFIFVGEEVGPSMPYGIN